ncbi:MULTISPECIES: sodium ion-translocating decarboxylase subunit beta [Fibrobacter]|jgi:oxaloacetate decarboxylase beta subunit|uniref:sodium ion-translocating decarboxylase subunit beta n=1 Tax=Fibrobacter TaxID=832 RepID=UPI0009191B64|nr:MULTISPECIES: sodium ion-translocating decarboxylase subunit beta [Fibrobacter]MBO6135906.1 sodium ion-translocating decarboxylase subunit beta [Fibrobacter sp.]MBQ3720635.1 sodium ion-translocating decarboxylase subunit beta [Fibrobacter sp.]MBQ9226805.1 sodium ion-translocating decarboxylase subunit beta [Fibrobacter sp.]MBR2308348.1 sodium ion-translocating decarboxylase subunit beta [Fibrobacter sp.]MBR4006288.1 sodium ion-translocating decarboxylase subunit beta [Fibrobacter sp.]
MSSLLNSVVEFACDTGFAYVTGPMVIMWIVSFVLMYLAIVKKYEPLLLLPISLGALAVNIPSAGFYDGGWSIEGMFTPTAGLYYYISQGIHLELFPPIIFLGVGAMTDFGPLIANPRTLLLGGGAQFGVFATMFCAVALGGFTLGEAASIGIIGGADGPTSIFTANKLAKHLIGPIAVAAYTYMALVPLIQPPIMRLMTNDKERKIRMKALRQVSKAERIVFAVMVMIVCILVVPDASALIIMLMLGNIFKEAGVVERLVKTSSNELMNIVTIFLGTSVGLTMSADIFLKPQTLMIIAMGVVAFGFSTAAGLFLAKIMNWCSPKNPVNPLIGSAGVSAVPMAARVSQVEGAKYDPQNFLLMHAMGPNVAGVIGTAVCAGYMISRLS